MAVYLCEKCGHVMNRCLRQCAKCGNLAISAYASGHSPAFVEKAQEIGQRGQGNALAGALLIALVMTVFAFGTLFVANREQADKVVATCIQVVTGKKSTDAKSGLKANVAPTQMASTGSNTQ